MAQSAHAPERYEAQQRLGRGTYGTVWQALDRQEDRLVAVKIGKDLFEDLVDAKRTLREVLLLSKLQSDHVVRLLDVVIPSEDLQGFNTIHLVMELCDSDLKKLFRSDVQLQAIHIKTLFLNLCKGLSYLHSREVCHRDLKPENCLVNQDCSVKICDFDLARPMGRPHGRWDIINRENQIVCAVCHQPILGARILQKGAPHHFGCIDDSCPWREIANPLQRQLTSHVVTRVYCAPELLLFQENYTTAIDIWSAGCIFFEALGMLLPLGTGRPKLFEGSISYPLSHDQAVSRFNRNELNAVFELLGTPAQDFKAMLSGYAVHYVELFEVRAGEGLGSKAAHADPDALELLEQLLCLHPNGRPSAHAVLGHKFLDDVRADGDTASATCLSLRLHDVSAVSEDALRRRFQNAVARMHGVQPKMLVALRTESAQLQTMEKEGLEVSCTSMAGTELARLFVQAFETSDVFHSRLADRLDLDADDLELVLPCSRLLSQLPDSPPLVHVLCQQSAL